jgi:hypothetical protein
MELAACGSTSRKRPSSASRRVQAIFVVALTFLLGKSNHDYPPPDIPAGLLDAEPMPAFEMPFFDFLDKLGATVASAYRRMEAKLGLDPKDWNSS